LEAALPILSKPCIGFPRTNPKMCLVSFPLGFRLGSRASGPLSRVEVLSWCAVVVWPAPSFKPHHSQLTLLSGWLGLSLGWGLPPLKETNKSSQVERALGNVI
jgi:hypothetical protein